MATRTKPLMAAASLATAAAVAVATPAIAPSISSVAPPALSSAKVGLTTFSDLLSIPASDWNNYYYNGWGGAINTDASGNPNYILPGCQGSCFVGGSSGLAYLALDALINGNGNGISDYTNWRVSAVNYFFEGSTGQNFASGVSAGLQYVLTQPFLNQGGPLYNPTVANLIQAAFGGGYTLSQLYVSALTVIGAALLNVPLVGPYLGRIVGSYVGPQFSVVDTDYDYNSFVSGVSPLGYAGISGVLRYIGGVITTGGNPNPYPTPPPTPTAATAKTTAQAAVAVATTAAADVAQTKTTPAATAPAATDPTTAAAPAADATASAAADATPAPAAVKTTRQRPVRDAVAGAAKAVGSAVSGAAKAATGGAAAASKRAAVNGS